MRRCRSLALLLISLLLSLFLFTVAVAQDEQPVFPADESTYPAGEPVEMDFQPPPDADSLDDFLPPGLVWNQVNVPAPGQQGLAIARAHATQAVTFIDDGVAVVMESGTVAEDVALQFTLISILAPDSSAVTESPTGTQESPAEETPELPPDETQEPPAEGTSASTDTAVNDAPTSAATLTPTVGVLEATTTPTATATLTGTADAGDIPPQTPAPTLAPDINDVATATPPPANDEAPAESPPEHDRPERVIEFQLEAVNTVTGEPASAFEKKARIVLDLRGYGFDVTHGGTFFLAYQDPQNPEEWIEVPVTTHQSDGLISADVAHFSSWATGWRPEGWTLQWEPPSADGFTGAARTSYSFQLPAGRAGLAPSLSLSYSNAALNGAIKRVSGGDVASGWSLNEIAIVRTGVKMSEGSISAMDYPNTFRLVLNGEGYKLVAHTNGVLYYAENAPHLRINRYTDYWTVETGDGTMYRLGYTDAARTWHHFVLNEHLDEDSDPNSQATHHSAYIEWHVDTITDRFGNQVVYQRTRTAATDHYEEIASCPWGGFCVLDFYTHASRLLNVYYNFQGRQNITALPVPHTVGTLSPSTAATRVELLYNNEGGRLSDVKIYHNSGSNPIRQYGLASVTRQVANPGCKSGASTRYSATHELTSITEYGWDGATGVRHSLPPVSFTYEARNNFVHDSQNCFIFKHLSEVSNGYGGKTKFTYASDGRAVGAYTNTGSGPTEYPQVGYSHFVSQVANFDGRKKSDGTLRSGVIAYARSGPCYNQYDTGYGPRCQVNDDAPRFGVLSGFADMTATYRDYDGSATNLVRTTYYQSATYFGRPSLEEVKNASNVLLTKSVYAYTARQFGGGVPFVHLSQRDTYQYQYGATSASLVTRFKYFYDEAEQGGQQWGKQTKQEVGYQKDDTGTFVIKSRQLTWYRGDASRWLVVPWQQGVWDASWQRQQTSLYHYDGHTGNPGNQALSKGSLTLQRSLLANAGYAEGGYTKYPTVDSAFVYDAYGNQTELRSYSGYGIAGNDGTNWSYFAAATGERKTVITYDSDFALYPVKVTNPLGHVTTFDVYGFKRADGTLAPVDGFQRQTGLLRRTVDANAVAIGYEYDPFGRLHAIFDAENSYAGFANTNPWDGNPLQRFRYWDNTWNNGTVFLDPANNKPFEITLEQRPGTWTQAGNGYAFNDQTFYDGLGRTIQTRSIYAEVDGQSLRREIYTSTDYNTRGNVVCQTVPYDLALYSDRGLVWPASPFDTTACNSKPRTTTTYDALGRPDMVTAPDGSITDNNYFVIDNLTVNGESRLRIHQIVDANQHVVNNYYDTFNQLVQVRNFTGTNPWTLYASTTYRYDAMGNLLNVTDAAGNITSMTYDALGRKLSMNDPDMGPWSYGYDAAGNLVWQKDANGKKLCFTYDALDRVKVRYQDTTPSDACPAAPTSGSTHLATYSYDTATYGKGQVATISWGPTPSQNKDTFAYDARGRMYKQTRLIDNRSYTLETTGFDALHRPLTVKYPSGEVVTYAYDREGENRLWAGSSLLVDKVTYNARAQMVRLRRGNSLETVFSYYGATGTAGNSNYRLQSMVAGSLLNLQYQYDKVGNITLMTDGLLAAGLNTQTFTYDALNRLKTAYTPSGAVGYYNQAYNYDAIGNITSYAGTSYTYLDTAHKHAVTHLGGAQKFWYDANGNMTKRVEGSITYVQTFDAENRLATVTNGSAVTTFSYDAAGQRTRTQQPNGVKTYYPFPGYEEEVNGSTTTRRTTYSLAGQTIAVRVQVVGGSNVFYYLHSDHLGSTTALSTSAVGGGLISGSTARYLPFGAWRTTPTQTLTDRGYTGHLENMELGLIYMNARYYVPAIGRFASADTIVPNPAEPQSFNRYAYTLNNPVNYSDPNGHNPAWCNDPYDGGGGPECEPMVDFTVSNGAGLSWEYDEKLEAIGAASLVDFALVQESGIGFQEVYGSAVTFQKTGKTCAEAFSNETYTCYGSSNGNLINIYTNAEGDLADNTRFFVHELGHSFERAVGDSVPSEAIIATDETDDSVNNRGGFAGPPFGWQQSTDDGAGEIFADMFIGWVYGQWEVDRFTGALTDDAALKANFMTTNMSVWIDTAYPGN